MQTDKVDMDKIKHIGEAIIRRKKAHAAFELVGFGMTLMGATVNAFGRGPLWLSLPLGVLSGLFAWRFVSVLVDMLVTWIIAAQRGTLIAVMLKQKGLDNWDCGNPDCEGCKKAREERENAKA